jgi:outer membrane protein
MKQKLAITRAAALAFLTVAAGTAHAQSAGTFYVATGWFHLAPQDSSDPLKIVSVGGTTLNQSVANTGASIDQADTIGLTTGYFITDNISAEFVGGVPPRFNLSGEGQLAQFGVLGHAYQWSPAVVFKYYFNKPEAKFRPYVGLGATYIWFTGAKITNGPFESEGLGGPTTVTTSNQWAPVFNLGFNYNIDRHWFAGLSLSYVPVSLRATLTTARETQVGTLTEVSQAKIKLDPIVTYLNIGYRF